MIAVPRQLVRRSRQISGIWHAHGTAGVIRFARSRLADAIAPPDLTMPVRDRDVLSANFDRPVQRAKQDYRPGEPLLINWIMTPPGAGSGGHTTIFRIVNRLQARGHSNRVYFYDIHFSDLSHYENVVRQYYGFTGSVANVDQGMADAHAVIATGWPTAYPAFNAECAGVRCYFVQDFEPDFHAVSASSVLAENTYRMGFHGITAGKWLADKLSAEYSMPADHFAFGCDLGAYVRDPKAERNGIAFYCRPDAPRRASELGLMAIALFAKRRPEVEIHLFGERIPSQPFPFIDHGHVTPSQLNAIYNRCRAGLSLSLTNVSLIPHEMLAAGCLPVVNDAAQNRVVLDNPCIRYAPLTPHGLANELDAVIGMTDFDAWSQRASESVSSNSWEDAATTVESTLHRLLKS